MAEFSAPGAWEAAATAFRATRTPTHYLGGAPRSQGQHRSGFSGTLPRLPSIVTAPDETAHGATQAILGAHRATLRRRRLLAIFGRMMARFHERHTRHWSMGRWECTVCHRRIVAWAWLPQSLPETSFALHEECANRSMWEIVLRHERINNPTL